MGNFYLNYTIRGDDPQLIARALKGRRAIVSPPERNSIVVFDEASDGQDSRIIEPLATHLATQVKSPVLAILNHDDDILQYWLISNEGAVVDRYDSSPSYFSASPVIAEPSGGNVALLCNTFGSQSEKEVSSILRWSLSDDNDDYVFAVDRHAALVDALDIARFAIGFGYGYATEDLDDLFPNGGYIKVE